jgi:hypothetical protein
MSFNGATGRGPILVPPYRLVAVRHRLNALIQLFALFLNHVQRVP